MFHPAHAGYVIRREAGLAVCEQRVRVPECRQEASVDEAKIDRAAMVRLAKSLTFIVGATDPATVAILAAADSGTDKDVKAARAVVLKLKSGARRPAMDMLSDRRDERPCHTRRPDPWR